VNTHENRAAHFGLCRCRRCHHVVADTTDHLVADISDRF
jgi:hypothetical protein